MIRRSAKVAVPPSHLYFMVKVLDPAVGPVTSVLGMTGPQHVPIRHGGSARERDAERRARLRPLIVVRAIHS